MSIETRIHGLLSAADITVGGSRPGDIVVNDPRFYARLLSRGALGLGESYVDGMWEANSVDTFICKILRGRLLQSARRQMDPELVYLYLKARLFNLQSRSRDPEIAAHYNIGNSMYRAMLDPAMVYSCGYWRHADSFAQAQQAKLDLACRKLYLEPGMKVLEIGCGWGSFAYYAAKNYGVSVTGYTISSEQAALARERCADLPVEIRLADYRDVRGRFDRAVSLGMFEHVGFKNHRTFMQVIHNALTEQGLFLLEMAARDTSARANDPWFERYVFPGGLLPSIAQIGRAIEHLLTMEDWHNFGADYDHTLMAWEQNFREQWEDFRQDSPHYTDRFFRLWRYYLLSCAGAFRARHSQMWQIVLSRSGLAGGYIDIR